MDLIDRTEMEDPFSAMHSIHLKGILISFTTLAWATPALLVGHAYLSSVKESRPNSEWILFHTIHVKADMKSYIPLETTAIFFLANLFPKQGISSEYVTADFICMGLLGLQGAKTENYKMNNSCPYRDSNSRPLILKSSALSMRLSSLIYKREFKLLQ